MGRGETTVLISDPGEAVPGGSDPEPSQPSIIGGFDACKKGKRGWGWAVVAAPASHPRTTTHTRCIKWLLTRLTSLNLRGLMLKT